MGVFIGCGDSSADDDAVVDVDVLPDVDVPMDVDDDAGEADGDTVEETEIAPVCGNGVLEDGEECDDGNDVSGDGCEPETCVFSCHEDDDCLEVPEDDPCTVNTCEEVTGGWACRSVPNEGASCDDGDSCTEDDRCDEAGICRAGTNVCHCPGGTTEECAVHEDDNFCNGTLVCNPVTRMCEVAPETVVTCPADEPCRTFTCVPETGECPGSDLALGTSCDDGLFCNGVDACNASGTCVSAGDPCPETCRTCNERSGSCDVVVGWCWVEDACWVDGAAHPGNTCRFCSSGTAPAVWTDRPDFTPCTLVTTPDYSYDICSGGTCVSPGSCGTAACNAPGPNWTIPDTNQRLCYDEWGSITCPGTAGSPTCSTTAFCGQDWQYGWDTSNPASARFARTGTTEPTVTDNVTGLVWQGCSAGQTGATCTGTAGTHTWVNALAYCEGLTWGGYDDWRLADAFELQTIVDYSRPWGPYIDPTAFPAQPGNDFWSSSSCSGSSSGAWGVHFDLGLVYYYVDKADSANVRCIRRGP